MTLAYPLTLNHCQSLRALGSLGNRNRSSIASPPICLALTREVHAVFMPVWDGFKLFSYQKAHSDILFERHRKPQISQPPFNHMSWFKRPESDLLPRRAVTAKEWDVIYHPEPHTRLITRALAFVHICAHMWGRTHTHTHQPLHSSTSHKCPKKTDQHMFSRSLIFWLNHSYMLSHEKPQFHIDAVLALDLLQCGVGSHAFYKLQLHHLPPRDPF